MRMSDRSARTWIVALALLGACDTDLTAPGSNANGETAAVEPTRVHPGAGESPGAPAATPMPGDAGRYTSLDPAACRLIEQNLEEAGYSRHACDGVAGYRIEISESDLRQDIVVIAPNGRRSQLQLSSIVAKGAFNALGKTAEWRGAAAGPAVLIVRLNVAPGSEPTRPDISNLVVARLASPACVVAVVPPGPDQNAAARRIADRPLPDCIGR